MYFLHGCIKQKHSIETADMSEIGVASSCIQIKVNIPQLFHFMFLIKSEGKNINNKHFSLLIIHKNIFSLIGWGPYFTPRIKYQEAYLRSTINTLWYCN